MTPEEAQALSLRLGAGPLADAAAPAVQGIDAFRQKLAGFGSTPAGIQVADRATHLAESALGSPIPGVSPLGLPPRGPGGLGDLSAAAQRQMRVEDAGGGLRPMATPSVNVEAAPTLEEQAKKPAPSARAGVMPGGGAGNGLASDLASARAGAMRTLAEERELTGMLGADKAGRIMAVGDLQEQEAARQQREADIERQAQATAAQRFDDHLAKVQARIDEVASAKVDPGRLFRNADEGTRFSMALGATLGGGLAALNGGPNTSLARLDDIISRDIRAQENAIDNKKSALDSQRNMLDQIIKETGSRDAARQQLRVLMLEAAKTKLQADADRLGIPEMRTNAELATNAIQQKIDAANVAMKQAALEAFQRQAAAAAAAQRAAEETAWRRSMELAQLGIARDKNEIERRKAEGLTGEDLNKQTQQLGKELGDKDLAMGREAVENAKRRLAGAKSDEGLPGVGLGADMRERLAPKPTGLNMINPAAHLLHAVAGLSDQERVSRGDWEKIKLAYQSQITGSGASEKEREMLSAAFEGAKSPAEQRNAIAQADAYFSRRESAIKAGFDPRAVHAFEQRLGGIRPELPASVKVKR